MGSSVAVGVTRQSHAMDEPSPLVPYAKVCRATDGDRDRDRDRDHDRDTTSRGGSAKRRLRREDFVRGKWEVELNDWRRHCVPNGWMVCCLPCVSVAQIAVRVGADSFGAALAKQLAFNAVVWSLVLLELAYCYLYISSVFGGGTERTSTPPIVIFSACFTVTAVSYVWVRSLAALRARVRERFHIAGSASDDTCAMAWRTPCAVAQMATQVKSYTTGSCDFRAPDTLPPYIP